MLIPIDIMAKNIKITEKQYKRLLEASEDVFTYFTDSDTKPYDGQVNVTANGKLTPEKNAKPTTGDEIQKSLDGLDVKLKEFENDTEIVKLIRLARRRIRIHSTQ